MASAGEGFRRLIDVFDRLGIHYFLSGSFASALPGLARATFDADFIADLSAEEVDSSVAELVPHFYADADQTRSALDHGRSFNVIHQASAYKFDIFAVGGDMFRAAQMQRRQVEGASPFGERSISISQRRKTQSWRSCSGMTRAGAVRNASGMTYGV